jgi:hypothetical protein
VLCVIVVPLPPGTNTFAVKINNNNKMFKKCFGGTSCLHLQVAYNRSFKVGTVSSSELSISTLDPTILSVVLFKESTVTCFGSTFSVTAAGNDVKCTSKAVPVLNLLKPSGNFTYHQE